MHWEELKENKKELEKLLQDIPSLLGLDCCLKEPPSADIRVRAGEIIIRLPLQAASSERTAAGDQSKQAKIDHEFIKELNEAVQENYQDQDFNVEHLAKILYVSQPTLYRKVKALTGATPCDFINSFRLDRALQLLKSNFGLVIDVALEVGFNSRVYFTKCFKDKYKQTPSQFLESIIDESRES
jgi:AraC-like DNA-binding protein